MDGLVLTKVDMFASVFIIIVSLVLLVYWFRYSCMLLLRNHAERKAVLWAEGQRFNFAEVRQQLDTAQALDRLHASLDRDYRIIAYLLQHAANLELESFEERLLVFDYRMMQLWYRLTRTLAPRQAREALREMASILAVLAANIGERAGLQNEA